MASLIDRAIAAEPSDPALMARPLRVHTRAGTVTNHDTDEGRARLGGHVSRARHRREGDPRPDDPRDRLGCRDRDRLGRVGGANAACGDRYSVHAREQGIWTTLRSRARPVRGKLPGSRTAITRKLGPSKLSGRRSGLDPIPQSEPAESGHSSPPQGDFPHPRSWPQASKETRSAAGSQ